MHMCVYNLENLIDILENRINQSKAAMQMLLHAYVQCLRLFALKYSGFSMHGCQIKQTQTSIINENNNRKNPNNNNTSCYNDGNG